MNWRFTSTFSLLAAGMLLITTMPAQAASPFPNEQSDISAMAAAKGITFDEAINGYKMRQSATAAVEQIGLDFDNFAGIWQDDSDNNWRMHVMVAKPEAIHSEAVVSALPANVPFEWELVKYDYATLKHIQQELIDQANTTAGASQFSSISVDVPNNGVLVGFRATDLELQALIGAKYGDAVEFVIEAPGVPVTCSDTNDPEGGSRYNCTYWRGGIELQTSSGSHRYRCTMSMWAKTGNGTKGLVSAGHCGSTEASHQFWHNGSLVGTQSVNTLRLNGQLGSSYRSDSLFIPASQSSVSYNKIYETPSSKAYAITSEKSSVQQLVGDWVCKHGVGLDAFGFWFGRDCGQITNQDTTWDTTDKNGTHRLVPAKAGSMNVNGGDSGAPVAYNGPLFGIAVGKSPSKWVTSRLISESLSA